MPNRASITAAAIAGLVIVAAIVYLIIGIGKRSGNLGVSAGEMDSVNRHFSKEEKRKPDTSPGDLGEFVDDLPDTGFANALLNALLKQFLANSKAALRGEAVLKFKSKEKMEEFLASNFPDGFKILGKSDALNAVRVGYDKAQSLWRSLVDSGVREGDLDIAPNFLVTYPSVPSPSTPVTEIAPQPDAQGFGYNLLDWLGVSEGQNANWGAGMKVAVIDGMIQSHETFREGQIKTTSLLDPDTPVDPNDGHATAVTSIYAGNTREAPGLTPLVEIDGYQVLDSTGNGDSFTLAEAIIQAVNNRADLINVSLGSYGNSQVVADAVAYAEQAGVPIVAAAGNDGTEGITFPAGYDYVIAVASIEAEGERMNFSNSGEQLDISAPGLEIPAAWPEGVVGFSGTSASAPVVGAAIVGLMSEYNINADEAYELLVTHSNEAGPPGPDEQYGVGNLNLARPLTFNTPGITDIGLASNYYDPNNIENGLQPTIQTTVENRGTEPIFNAQVSFVSGLQRLSYQIPQLAPGETHTQAVPVDLSNVNAEGFLPVNTNVSLTGGQVDQRFRDNGVSSLVPIRVDN